MQPWYKVVTPRQEVREGRSFSPDEFAIALEQVVAGTAPADYRDPAQFFSRTCFTRALTEHAGMVLRRLSGRTENTAPVLALITQFGGGKTHTLTALYHLATRRRGCRSAAGRVGSAHHGRDRNRALGPRWRIRRQCLGSNRGARDALDRFGPPAGAATRASLPWAPPRGPPRRVPRRWPGCSPPRTPRCCCCSMKC